VADKLFGDGGHGLRAPEETAVSDLELQVCPDQFPVQPDFINSCPAVTRVLFATGRVAAWQ
jgi:hypothetical protein